MYREKKILGLIPARGGSKGLPGKNIKPMLEKPLIAWTIEQAKHSKYIDTTIVSTDDQKIAEVSKKYGVRVPFMRPSELATDEASTFGVITHALDYLRQKGESFDYLALLEPTSPLRKLTDIDNAIKELIDKEDVADSLVSIGKITLEHPCLVKQVDRRGFMESFYKTDVQFKRRQDLPVAYFPYGVIYLSKISALKKYKTFYQNKLIPYIIERWQNYEVDDKVDLFVIERIMKEYLLGKF